MPTLIPAKMIDPNGGALPVSVIPNMSASKITSGTLNAQRVPVAPASTNAGQGFGGFRYSLSGDTLNLYTT